MKLSQTENTIINAMARAFFVSAWADKQEELREKGKKYQHPGSGGDWFDIAPKTPKYAREFALIFTGNIGGSLLVHLNNAAWADVCFDEGVDTTAPGFRRFDRPDLEEAVEARKTGAYQAEFGHYLAMQGLGHGVGWFDSHAKFDIKIPHTEFYI